jgi:hypothetical protein
MNNALNVSQICEIENPCIACQCLFSNTFVKTMLFLPCWWVKNNISIEFKFKLHIFNSDSTFTSGKHCCLHFLLQMYTKPWLQWKQPQNWSWTELSPKRNSALFRMYKILNATDLKCLHLFKKMLVIKSPLQDVVRKKMGEYLRSSQHTVGIWQLLPFLPLFFPCSWTGRMGSYISSKP